MKRVLITGTARSGTGYMAQYLRRWCSEVGHENVYGLHRNVHGQTIIDPSKLEWPTGPSWGSHLIEVSWLAAPFLHRMTQDTMVVVHLVRNPIKAIASIYRRGFLVAGNAYGEFANTHLGGDYNFFAKYEPMSPGRACYYWCKWNMMVLTSKVPMCVWRVETLAQSDLAYVLNTAQVPYKMMGPPARGVNQGDGVHDPNQVPECLADIPVEFQERVSQVGRLFGYEVQ